MDRHLQRQLSTTMSDDGDHTCPLCAEEMDITDQQLKPCKCGYDICVWCWHHIIDMAEKEETEGRCPACRTPYDKDRIVKMAATCNRMVAEKNAEKKHKIQKVKPKAATAAAAAATSTVEAKKHLAGVRVIQRNLVYIIGLPAHLCNESVLERREYFGQYGKVLKVSVSRPTGPPSQQASANNNISVYITYAKEEEAIRCIQAVHNFFLEGKVLRACFGTTKYCHAWLRNMTCGNPDCLYLHEVGGQEDSFTKDEVISAYTRTRVPQMASSVSQRRAGTVLPPPADDFSYSAVVSAKHTIKNGTLNTNNQPRVSHPNSSSGRSTLPPASSWGHRDLNARTTASGVTSSQSQKKSKAEPQINSFSSSSTIPSTIIPSSWNDDTSTMPKMSEGRQVSEQESTSKTIEPYKPGIMKETHSLSSLDIDFSTIPSAWNDDDIVVSDGMSKGSEEIQAAKENGKLTHLAYKSPISPKKDVTMNITSKCPSDFVSDLAILESDVKTGDGDSSVTKITPKSPTSADVNCQSCLAADEKILEESGPRETDIEKLSVQISSIKLDGNDEAHGMAGNHQPDAMPCMSVTMPIGQNFDRGQSHMKLDELLPSENKDTVLSCQYGSDKHLDWTSEQQSCSATPLNDIVSSTVITDKLHSRLMDGSDQPSYSSFAGFPNTLGTSLWNDTESNPTLMFDTRTSQMQSGFSSIDKARDLLNGGQDGLGTVCTPGNDSGHPGMGTHQPGAMGSVRTGSVGSFDNTVGVNKDESRIISDMLSSEFNLWDDSFSPANNFLRMLRESENNDVPFTAPSWKSGSGSRESRFSFARQDNQGNSDSSLRNCASDQNFSLLPQISRGNFYQNGRAFQSLDNDASNSNSLAMSDMATTGSSRSKISAPPGFSAPARVLPPGFPSQDGQNPPPGFSSGISSQEVYKTPLRLPSPFSSGLSSQDGPNPPSRSFSAFSSGLSLQDGPNHPSRFPSAFTSGFSSQDGSNQVYGSMYPETRLRDNVLGSNSNHYQVPFGRHTNDIEFNDPAILAVGKGRMPGIGDSGLEMKNTHAFPAHLQTSNNDPRFQLQMQPNVQSHQNLRFTDHTQDAFNPMNDNYLASRFLQQSHGHVSPYAQMPQQPRNSQLTNGHLDGWSDLRQGNNTLMPDMSRMLYPSEVNNLHVLGSNDIYTRAFGM
ncbi:putative GPI-anchored protein PB15E9.01c [Panicum miliaceum]|uniref:GPI-anchored protein PB15E9.01c n=1 Tax=Panicum miliaceum TaxID=4540 RepID=A0A3L6PJZ7_PANMI|nr:putative GPI-anchored protein PB15E9.01c [Panicum miliaceum]